MKIKQLFNMFCFNVKIGKLFIYLLMLPLMSAAQSSDEYVSYRDLQENAKKSIAQSISNGDNFSLLVDEILLQDFDKDKPEKILEVVCTFVKPDRSERTFSTVVREKVTLQDNKYKFGNGFILLQDITLSDVQELKISVKVRSLDKEQSATFGLVASLLSFATEANPAIHTIQNLLRIKPTLNRETGKEEVPTFDASFFIPTNYINYFRLAKESRLPLLRPTEDIPVAFTAQTTGLPKNLLARFANLIVQNQIITDKEKVTGVLTLKVSRAAPKPILPVVQDKLNEAYNSVRSNQLAQLTRKIDEARTRLDIAYSTEDDKRSSAYKSANFYLSLLDCFVKSKGNRDEFYTHFRAWVEDKAEVETIDNLMRIPVRDVYRPLKNDPANMMRVVYFYNAPNLSNELLLHCFAMQKALHEEFNRRSDNNRENDVDAISHLVERK